MPSRIPSRNARLRPGEFLSIEPTGFRRVNRVARGRVAALNDVWASLASVLFSSLADAQTPLDVDGRRRVDRAGAVGVDGECGTVRSVIRGRRWGVGERGERAGAERWAKVGFVGGADDGVDARRYARSSGGRRERRTRTRETRSGSIWRARWWCGGLVARVFVFAFDGVDVEDFGQSVGVDVARARWWTTRWATPRGFPAQL